MSISVQDIEKLIKEGLPLMIKKTPKNFKGRIDANMHTLPGDQEAANSSVLQS